MNICLATYQSVMLLKGGPRTQIVQTKRGLEELGAKVALFESWKEFDPRTIDLVHIFGSNLGTYHLAREIRKLGIPMVVTPIFFTRHSSLVVRPVVALDRAVRTIARGIWNDYSINAEICSWAKAVLPNTIREAHLIEKGLGIPGAKITVVPNGVEERFSHGDPSLFTKTYGVKNFILNVGHIGPERKNIFRLLLALERIQLPAVIIGRIEQSDEGRRCLDEAKKNPRVQIIDSLPQDSDMLASAYAACDVFALPSLFETPGIAALEAALAGAKIVITRHGGTEEYFGGYAEYVEPTSFELIHHGILTALNKSKDPTLREHIRTKYLWSNIAQQTLAIYERVLAAR